VWAAVDELVVLESVGAVLAAGARIDGTKPLTLTAGQRVTLIAANGRMIRLEGPGNAAPLTAGAAGGDDGRLARSLQAFLGAGTTNTAKLGAIRAVGGGAPQAAAGAGESAAAGTIGGVVEGDEALPDPWLFDVSRSGERCLHGGDPVVLWRPEHGPEVVVSISLAGGGWSAEARWPEGYARLASPDVLPRTDGARYHVALDGRRSDVRVHLIPGSVTEPAVLAAWLVDKGCTAQARALLADAAPSAQ